MALVVTVVGVVFLLGLFRWQGARSFARDRAKADAAWEKRKAEGPEAAPTTASQPSANKADVAAELQALFDTSQLRGWDLQFRARGAACEYLHVEGSTNLEPEMMTAMAHGSLFYGEILPGGVNQFAFSRGFTGVVFTNQHNEKLAAFGEGLPSRKKIRSSRVCSRDTPEAAALPTRQSSYVAASFERLSWENAKPGAALFNGAHQQEAMVVSVDRDAGLIRVQYLRSGSIEEKDLAAVAKFWYVNRGGWR